MFLERRNFSCINEVNAEQPLRSSPCTVSNRRNDAKKQLWKMEVLRFIVKEILHVSMHGRLWNSKQENLEWHEYFRVFFSRWRVESWQPCSVSYLLENLLHLILCAPSGSLIKAVCETSLASGRERFSSTRSFCSRQGWFTLLVAIEYQSQSSPIFRIISHILESASFSSSLSFYQYIT